MELSWRKWRFCRTGGERSLGFDLAPRFSERWYSALPFGFQFSALPGFGRIRPNVPGTFLAFSEALGSLGAPDDV